MRMVWSSVIALATAGALVGCGGGGGGGGSSGGTAGRDGLITSTERSGPTDFTAEANRNYALAQVGALGTYTANRTGAGVKVAIIDTGIDVQHQDFAGALDPASIDIVSNVRDNVDDQAGHGTAVAGIIGARADGYDARGIAPDATLLAIRSDSTCSPKCSFRHSDLAAATDYAVANNARIINYSLGGDSMSAAYQAALTNSLTPGTLADGTTPDPAKERVIVAAAGNAGNDQPINPAAFVAGADGQGRGIAVGAVGTDGVTLAPFSNKAGATKDHYLVAPGVSVVSTANGGGTRAFNGTSFAAPVVSGAAAVVWGASPFLTGDQVVDILLGSATDLGDAGVDEVYGHGLLNLDRALQPLGVAAIPTGANVSAGGAPLAATSLNLGGAFGDALSRGGALQDAMFVDSYGRPFHTDLSGAVHSPAKSDPLASWLDPDRAEVSTTRLSDGTSLTLAAPSPEPSFGIRSQPGEEERTPRFALSTALGGTQLGMARGFGLDQMTGLAAAQPDLAVSGISGNPLASPHLTLAGDGTAVSAGRQLGDGVSLTLGFSQDGGTTPTSPVSEPSRKASLAEAAKHFQDGSVIGGQVGTLTEQSGPLASSSGGAFGFGQDAETVFLGFFGATPVNDRVSLFGRWGVGMTDGAALNSGLVRDATAITSQSFALGATARDVGMAGDKVTLTASKPLRVTSGSALLAVPVGRAMDGTVLTRDQRVSLSPSGSETDLELSWAVPVGSKQWLTLGGMVAFEPGHDASAPPAFAAGAKYRLIW